MNDFIIKESPYPIQLARLADTRDIEECRSVFAKLSEVLGLAPVQAEKSLEVFDDIRALYEGRFKGYKACDTEYHDFRHVLDVVLAALRITDSLMLDGGKIFKKQYFSAFTGRTFP